MISGTANLITQTITYDSIGQSVVTESATTVFVDEKSITRTEWAEAGRNGFNPEIVLVTPFMNYSGQRFVDYNNVRYAVYRTYQSRDNVELYLEKKGGAGSVYTPAEEDEQDD